MDRKPFWIFIGVIYAVSLISVLAGFSPGGIGAGLSLGFKSPFEHWHDLIIFTSIGILACYLRRESLLVLPLAVIGIMAVRSMTDLEVSGYSWARYFQIGTILLFAMTVALVRSRIYWGTLTGICSVSYVMTAQYFHAMPHYVNGIYYMFGFLTSDALMMCTGIAMGFLLQGIKRRLELSEKHKNAMPS